MNSKKILKILEECHAITNDTHVVYTSGRHGSVYINKRAIYPYPHILRWIGKEFAKHFLYDQIEIVAGPAIGGIPLAYSTAEALGKKSKQQARALFAEKTKSNTLEFCPEYADLLLGRRVLIVEDIVTTGSSLKKMIDQVQANKGFLIGIICLVNRGGITNADLELSENFKFVSLAHLNLKSYEPSDCPLCQKGVPINTSIGQGKKFLASQAPK